MATVAQTIPAAGAVRRLGLPVTVAMIRAAGLQLQLDLHLQWKNTDTARCGLQGMLREKVSGTAGGRGVGLQGQAVPTQLRAEAAVRLAQVRQPQVRLARRHGQPQPLPLLRIALARAPHPTPTPTPSPRPSRRPSRRR